MKCEKINEQSISILFEEDENQLIDEGNLTEIVKQNFALLGIKESDRIEIEFFKGKNSCLCFARRVKFNDFLLKFNSKEDLHNAMKLCEIPESILFSCKGWFFMYIQGKEPPAVFYQFCEKVDNHKPLLSYLKEHSEKMNKNSTKSKKKLGNS